MHIDEQITFRKLEIFLRFLELGNMAHVGDALQLSTVSVHRALHSLEEGVRCPLFRRDGRKLVPLASAYTFADYATRVLRDCMDGIQKAQQAAGFSSNRLKVGALYSLTVRTIPQLLIGLKTRRPDLDVDLTLSSNQDLLNKLAKGEVDAIAIALDAEPAFPQLEAVPIFVDDIWFAAPVGSRFSDCAEIDLRETREESFISLNDDFATYHSFQHAFGPAGFEPRIAMRVGDIFSLMNLVSGGVGYALLPGRVAEFNQKIQLIPLARPYKVSQRITLLVPENRQYDPNLLALVAECRMFSRNISPPNQLPHA